MSKLISEVIYKMMSASTILDQDISRHQLIFQCFYESLTEDFGIKMDQQTRWMPQLTQLTSLAPR